MARKYKKTINRAVKKAIARYYRVTCGRCIQLVGSPNGVALAGAAEGYVLNQMVTGTSTFQELGKQFSLVKLRGVYIEAVPCSSSIGTGMICLALQQADEENNNGTVYSQPNVMSVSEQQITKKYIPVNSEWQPTNALTTLGNLKLAYQVIQAFAVQKNWYILIKLYLTFKNSL